MKRLRNFYILLLKFIFLGAFIFLIITTVLISEKLRSQYLATNSLIHTYQVNAMNKTEYGLLQQREETVAQAQKQSYFVLGIVGLFAYFFLGMTYLFFIYFLKMRQKEKKDLIEHRAEKINLEFALNAAELGAWDINFETNKVVRNIRHDQIYGYKNLLPNWTYEFEIKHIHPEDRENVKKQIAAVKDKNKSLEIEFRIFDANNKLRWLWARGSKAILHNGESHMVGVLRDVTQQKITEERLLFLSNILKCSIEYSIIPLDLDWKILGWNEGAHLNYGYDKNEIIGHNVKELHIQEDLKSGKVDKFLREVEVLGKASGFFVRQKKDKEHFLASVTMSQIRDSSDTASGYLLISRNITEQERLLAKYESSNKELEQFAYVASHDLKAPLRSIESLISWIEKDNENKLSSESKENYKLLISRVQRMSNLIEGILQYSRIGHLEAKIELVSLTELLDDVIESLNPPKTFMIRYPRDMPIIQAIKVPLSQVFSNLISNAIKFHHKKDGHIKIGVEDIGKYYEFYVSDDGPGIEPQYHEKIFEVFQTLQSRDVIESTGIGLSIVKKVIEEQGGKVTVESELGKGTTFRFTYPKKLLTEKKIASIENLF